MNTLPNQHPLVTPARPSYYLTPQPAESSPVSHVVNLAATLTVASAVSIGSNMILVKNGLMTTREAVVHSVVKGAAASLILAFASRSTYGEVAIAAGALATAGYLIDSRMKASPLDNRKKDIE